MNPCANRRYPFQNIFLPNHFLLISPGFSTELSFPGIYQITWKNCLIIDVPFSFPWGLIEEGESISAESTVEVRRSQFKSSSNYRQILFCVRAFGAITIILHFLRVRFCSENLELIHNQVGNPVFPMLFYSTLSRIFETYIPRNEIAWPRSQLLHSCI